MHLDTVYIQVHSKNYESRKGKTSYSLEWRKQYHASGSSNYMTYLFLKYVLDVSHAKYCSLFFLETL
jgi:hypothetical protein